MSGFTGNPFMGTSTVVERAAKAKRRCDDARRFYEGWGLTLKLTGEMMGGLSRERVRQMVAKSRRLAGHKEMVKKRSRRLKKLTVEDLKPKPPKRPRVPDDPYVMPFYVPFCRTCDFYTEAAMRVLFRENKEWTRAHWECPEHGRRVKIVSRKMRDYVEPTGRVMDPDGDDYRDRWL